MIDILMTHIAAHRQGKPPFFFSQFNFERMSKLGNTHYCFACMARGGYRPNNDGKPTNIHKDDVWAMEDHTVNHAPYVIGDADKYTDVWSWLEAKVTQEFPYIVIVPQLP